VHVPSLPASLQDAQGPVHAVLQQIPPATHAREEQSDWRPQAWPFGLPQAPPVQGIPARQSPSDAHEVGQSEVPPQR
jgi:hypothetical protein